MVSFSWPGSVFIERVNPTVLGLPGHFPYPQATALQIPHMSPNEGG